MGFLNRFPKRNRPEWYVRAVTKAIDLIEVGEPVKARAMLMRAQQETEELYIEGNRKEKSTAQTARRLRRSPWAVLCFPIRP